MVALYGKRALWKETQWLLVLSRGAEAQRTGSWNPELAAKVRAVQHEIMQAAERLDVYSFMRLAEIVERKKKLGGRWENDTIGKLLAHTGGEGEVNLDQLLKPRDGRMAVLDCDRKTAGAAARFLGLRVKNGRPKITRK